MAETELEMARRHVEEAGVRVEQQRALVDQLRADGPSNAAESAARLLGLLLAIQSDLEVHLRNLEARP